MAILQGIAAALPGRSIAVSDREVRRPFRAVSAASDADGDEGKFFVLVRLLVIDLNLLLSEDIAQRILAGRGVEIGADKDRIPVKTAVGQKPLAVFVLVIPHCPREGVLL